MFKFVRVAAVMAAVVSLEMLAAEESTTPTASGFQNFLKKVQEAGSKVDFAQLSAGAMKAQETLGPLLSQFKNASQPFLGDVQKKLADAGVVPTTTANPVGSVLKNLQVVGIGSDVDVAKIQENAKKAQETLGPLFGQFSSFLSKKSSSSSGGQVASQPAASAAPAAKSPIDDFIIEDPVVAASPAAAPPPPTPSASVAPTTGKSSDFQNAFKTIQEAGSKIDINKVQEGAKKIGAFFSQFKGSSTN